MDPKREQWTNPNIFFLFNTDIREYDMKNAGFSLCKEYNLLNKSTIEKLASMPKEKQTRRIGKIQQKDFVFKDKLKEAFVDARRRFYEANNIEESDIISVKKDAIFTSKNCKVTLIGNHINFRVKNSFSSYIRLSKKIELYYNGIETTVKGIGDEKLEFHREFMLSFINKYFYQMENYAPEKVIDFVRKFIDEYKKGDIEVGYYRSFDEKSIFKMSDGEPVDDVAVNPYEIGDNGLDKLNNYTEVLVKLIKIPL